MVSRSPAFCVAEIDDVVVAAVTGQVDPAHRVRRKGYRATVLAVAFLVGVAQRLLHTGWIVGRVEWSCVVGARSGDEQSEQEDETAHAHWSSAMPQAFRDF
ncbi:hypothetical protein BRDID11002_44750 [Bradyrhizobium diazoefficiens]